MKIDSKRWKETRCYSVVRSMSESNQFFFKLIQIQCKYILYFDLLQFSRQEWSVAPSIFNNKLQELAHCILWVKLSQQELYGV